MYPVTSMQTHYTCIKFISPRSVGSIVTKSFETLAGSASVTLVESYVDSLWLMIQPLGGVIVPLMYRRGVPLSVFWKLELTFSQEVTPWNTLPSNISNYDTATEILPVHVLFSLDISGVCLPYHNYDIQGSKSTIMRNITPVGFYYLWSKIKFVGSNVIRMDMLKTNKALYWCNKDNTKIYIVTSIFSSWIFLIPTIYKLKLHTCHPVLLQYVLAWNLRTSTDTKFHSSKTTSIFVYRQLTVDGPSPRNVRTDMMNGSIYYTDPAWLSLTNERKFVD